MTSISDILGPPLHQDHGDPTSDPAAFEAEITAVDGATVSLKVPGYSEIHDFTGIAYVAAAPPAVGGQAVVVFTDAREPLALIPGVASLELDRAECALDLTGRTGTSDIDGCQIAFTVTTFPVLVVLELPVVQVASVSSGSTGLAIAKIADLAGTEKRRAPISLPVGSDQFGWLRAEERIDVPGSYERKARITFGGNVTAGSVLGANGPSDGGAQGRVSLYVERR